MMCQTEMESLTQTFESFPCKHQGMLVGYTPIEQILIQNLISHEKCNGFIKGHENLDETGTILVL